MKIAKLRASALHLQPVNAIWIVWLSKVMEVQGPKENKATGWQNASKCCEFVNFFPKQQGNIYESQDNTTAISKLLTSCRCAFTTRKKWLGCQKLSDGHASIKPTRKYAHAVRLAVTPVVLKCYV